MKYPAIDKHAFAVFKAIKHFHPYLLRSHTKVIVPHTVVRALLIQKELGDQRGNWLTTLQEYDLEIKPAKLVKGQGLCKLVAEAQDPQKNKKKDGKMRLICHKVKYYTYQHQPTHGITI